MKKTERNAVQKIKKITAVAMFCALSYVCMLVIKIPVQFLTLDVKDSLIILCALLFGPISGIAIAVIVPLLEMITISGTGVYGFLMNMLSSVVFSATTGVIYRYKKSMSGAIIGLVSGVFAVTAVMLLANLWITPYYLGGTTQQVAAMIPKILLPFNLIKAILNAAIVLLFYKPLSNILKKIGFIHQNATRNSDVAVRTQSTKRTVWISAVALGIIFAALAVIFFVLRG